MPRKKKQNTLEPLPLRIVKDFEKQYPGVWGICKDLRSTLKQQDFTWDDRCYIPGMACVEFTNMFKWGDTSSEKSVIATLMFALSSWRRYKEIYSFDSTFADLLMKSATDEIIPSEILNSMPYPSFYISIDGDNDLGVDGFFCCIDTQLGGDVKNILNIVAFTKQGISSIPIIIDAGVSLNESMNIIQGYAIEKSDDFKSNDSVFSQSKSFAEKAMQLILYICSINADINENPQQKSINRKSSHISEPKDVLREVRKWDVGYRIGKIIRDSDKPYIKETGTDSSNHSKHTMKRPHTRRGHFHHFWVGSKTDNTRKLVLKWVAPMFINSSLNEELPAIINNIESQEE